MSKIMQRTPEQGTLEGHAWPSLVLQREREQYARQAERLHEGAQRDHTAYVIAFSEAVVQRIDELLALAAPATNVTIRCRECWNVIWQQAPEHTTLEQMRDARCSDCFLKTIKMAEKYVK